MHHNSENIVDSFINPNVKLIKFWLLYKKLVFYFITKQKVITANFC